ncbi:MAG: hypothetical protein EPN93_15490 [Spirochaetes bacterium]|nr:MAG: hypothetical protein EPN93_15490 [Spirochaetota bacterium]
MRVVHKTGLALVAAILCVAITGIRGNAKDIQFENIEVEKISRYDEDRIAYQQVEKDVSPLLDPSLATLLIIKDRKIYLIKDGYDNLRDVQTQRLILEMENKLLGDLWPNKIDNKPDFIRVTERRVELLKNTDEVKPVAESRKEVKAETGAETKGETKDFVERNFGSFFISVRNALLKKHVAIFRQLMRDRRESGLIVDRFPLPKPTYLGAAQVQKYGITVVGKTIDEKVYYAEDADGDGVAEIFYVDIPDGFTWGYNSGPNIIFIYNNRQKDIQDIIGSLTNDAYFGTKEEEEHILKTFPKDSDIIREYDLELPAEKK